MQGKPTSILILVIGDDSGQTALADRVAHTLGAEVGRADTPDEVLTRSWACIAVLCSCAPVAELLALVERIPTRWHLRTDVGVNVMQPYVVFCTRGRHDLDIEAAVVRLHPGALWHDYGDTQDDVDFLIDRIRRIAKVRS